MKLRFTPRATHDLAEIAEYVRTRNLSAAPAVRGAILRSLQNLTLFRQSVVPKMSRGVRKLVTTKYRYFVYYAVNEAAEEVVILTIRHSARRRKYQDL